MTYVDQEIPVGPMNSSNATFILTFAPNPPKSLDLYYNGVHLQDGLGYNLSNNIITMSAGYIPRPGTSLVACYRTL